MYRINQPETPSQTSISWSDFPTPCSGVIHSIKRYPDENGQLLNGHFPAGLNMEPANANQ